MLLLCWCWCCADFHAEAGVGDAVRL